MTDHPTYALRLEPGHRAWLPDRRGGGRRTGLDPVPGLAAAVAAGKPLFDPNQYSGVGEWLYALLFWGLFLTPGPLVGLFAIGWPALLIARGSRPNWLKPRPVYAIGFLAVIAGQCLTIAPLVAVASPLMIPMALLSASVMGAAFAAPASVVFRWIVLRRATSPTTGAMAAA